MTFPISLKSPPSHPPQTLRESHSTPLSLTHPLSHPTTSMLFPSHLPFGDTLPAIKHDSSLRIGFCNIGGFPALAKNNPKVSDIKAFIASHNLDLFGSCKSNLNWTTLPEHTQLKEWFCMADSCQTLVVHNTHENFGRSQYRGTFWIAVGHASCHISSSDCDPSKLGCWVSCTLCRCSGKNCILYLLTNPALIPPLNFEVSLRNINGTLTPSLGTPTPIKPSLMT